MVSTVPEVGCLTGLMLDGAATVRPTVPARTQIRVARADVAVLGGMSLYVSAADGPNSTVVTGLSLLAPRSWHCSADQGTDGNSSITVVPTSQVPCQQQPAGTCERFGAPSLRPKSVSLSSLGLGSMESALCAWSYFAKTFCPIAPIGHPINYPGEVVKALGQWELAYEDPAGVHGHGPASGGWDPDNGVVMFEPPPASWKINGKTYKAPPKGTPMYYYEGASRQGDCTLPSAQSHWCSVILDEVLPMRSARAAH